MSRDIRQFALSIEKSSGRKNLIKAISKYIGQPVITFGADVPSNNLGSASPGLLECYAEMEKVLDALDTIDRDIPELQNADTVIAHGVLEAEFLKGTESTIVLRNHSSCKQYTELLDYYLQTADDTQEWLIKRDLDEIREEWRRIFDQSDIVICESSYTKNIMEQWFGIDAHISRPPTDLEFFTPSDTQGSDYYLAVHRQEWDKRPHMLIRAFQQLDEKLVVVGKGYYHEGLKAATNDIDNIEYEGHVSRERLRSLYRNAKALVHTELGANMPTVVRESVACGTPCVCSEVGGQTDLISDETGVLFQEERPARSLSETIQSFNPGSYHPSELRSSVSQYSVSNSVEHMIDLVRQHQRSSL